MRPGGGLLGERVKEWVGKDDQLERPTSVIQCGRPTGLPNAVSLVEQDSGVS
jgi:hypothetical protein